MRVILCDVCDRKIVNSPIVKMKISYEYPDERSSTPTKDQMFVAVSGSMLPGYNSWYNSTKDGHLLEMCIQCAQYTDLALRNRKNTPPTPSNLDTIPTQPPLVQPQEIIDDHEKMYDNISV